MAMSSNRLSAAMQTSIYTRLKTLQEAKIPSSVSAEQRADIDQTWQDIATAVAEAAADVITEIVDYAEVEAYVKKLSFCTAATGCVLNPDDIPLNGDIIG